MHQWFAQAPSNIALIKYMGKLDEKNNIPANPSLSYTLNQLQSSVELELHPGPQDLWEPLETPGSPAFILEAPAQKRFLSHLQFIKQQFNYHEHFIVRSTNNFPHSSGLASSASSFAALTKCACLALSEILNQPLPSIPTQAQWSRLGSGSSCRSFFAPWALWEQEDVHAIELPYSNLIHHVVLISSEIKPMLSKAAHLRVHSSPDYQFRPARAKQRLTELLSAFKKQRWDQAFNLVWDEFMDMHHLFHSAQPPFQYMTPKSQEILNIIKKFWSTHQDGPLATMDAGPNVHLLFREDQQDMATYFLHEYLVNQFNFI